MTKYPIILIHGLGMRDDLKWASYWGKIPQRLETEKIPFYFSHQQAFNSIEENAQLIKDRILEILEKTRVEKMNIIAHSKGGVESRYMISKLNMEDKIASLTTLATPHRGSFLADWALEKVKEHKVTGLAKNVFKAIATWQGDHSPEIMPSFEQMTTESMQKLNSILPDSPHVYYQSYAGSTKGANYGLWAKFKDKIIKQQDGENDSVVSVESAKWGDFKGIIKTDDGIGVSHHEMVDLTHYTNFDAPEFYIKLIKDLKEMGF